MSGLLAAVAGCDQVFQLERGQIPCLDDDFADPMLDPFRWNVLDPSNRDVRVEPTGGMLVATLPARVDAQNGLEARKRFDFTGVMASVEVIEAPADPAIELGFYLLDETDGYYLINFYQSSLLVRVRSLGVNVDHVVNYDPVRDRFVRMSHDVEVGTMRIETSADGLAWTLRRDEPATVPVDSLQVLLLAHSYDGGPAAEHVAILDNFTMTGGACGK